MSKKLLIIWLASFISISSIAYGIAKFRPYVYEKISLADLEPSKGYSKIRIVEQSYEGRLWQNRFDTSKFISLNFQNTNIAGLRLANSEVSAVQFLNSTLDGAQFIRSSIQNTVFKKSSLRASKFIQTNLRNVSFEQADLSESAFLSCEFSNVIFDDQTKLPFSRERAKLLGMTYVSKPN